MSGREEPLHKVELPNDFGKSIFPTFNVNVPMPSGTAVPPPAPSGGAGGERPSAPPRSGT